MAKTYFVIARRSDATVMRFSPKQTHKGSADMISEQAARAWESGDKYLVDKILALQKENARLLTGIKNAADYLAEGRDGDASFILEALQAK